MYLIGYSLHISRSLRITLWQHLRRTVSPRSRSVLRVAPCPFYYCGRNVTICRHCLCGTRFPWPNKNSGSVPPAASCHLLSSMAVVVWYRESHLSSETTCHPAVRVCFQDRMLRPGGLRRRGSHRLRRLLCPRFLYSSGSPRRHVAFLVDVRCSSRIPIRVASIGLAFP